MLLIGDMQTSDRDSALIVTNGVAFAEADPDSVQMHSVTLPSVVSRETPRMDELPDYAPSQLAYHRAHHDTLTQMVATLPLRTGERVLDLATGDGSYAILLAGQGADVVAVDVDEKYLHLAEQRARREEVDVLFQKADAYSLPFSDGEMDGAFCAQSFYDLENTSRVLQELKRVVREGGWLGILENDSIHHLVLPWPADLEIEIRAAQLKAYAKTTGDEQRFYVGRRLVPLLKEVGCEHIEEKSFSTQKRAPLTYDERCFLQYHLTQLFELVESRLSASARDRAERLCNPGHREFMLDQPDFSATILDFLAWGRLPHKNAGAK